MDAFSVAASLADRLSISAFGIGLNAFAMRMFSSTCSSLGMPTTAALTGSLLGGLIFAFFNAIITGILDVDADGFLLRELAPGLTVDDVKAATAAPMRVAPDVREMQFD